MSNDTSRPEATNANLAHLSEKIKYSTDFSQNEPILTVTELKKHYETDSGLLDRFKSTEPDPVRAVDGVSFSVKRGETVGIVGESGCGKSTLAETLLGLKQPTGGSASLFGRDIHDWIKEDKKRFARQVQFVFQDPSSSLDPRLTVRELIQQPLEVHNVGAKDHQMSLVKETIEQVGLSTDQLDRYPSELSGGQRQRVGIARAIILEPQVLVLDEPTSALDVSVQAQILNLLKDIKDELDLTTLIISHDISVIRYLCDKVIVMYLGQIAEIGPTEGVFNAKSHPYTQVLLENVPKVGETDTESSEVNPDIPSPRNPPEGCRFHTRCPKVIPPEEYDLSQDEWVSLMRYKIDLRTGTLQSESLAKIATTLEIDPDDSVAVQKMVRDDYDLPQELTDQAAEELLEESLEKLVNGSDDEAYDMISAQFRSPCEETNPSSKEKDMSHRVNCHLAEEKGD